MNVTDESHWRGLVSDARYLPGGSLALALRLARLDGSIVEVQRLALQERRDALDHMTVTQGQFMRNMSRRPQRNHHADSWTAREKYARCETWPSVRTGTDRQAYADRVLMTFPGWGIAAPFHRVRRLPVGTGEVTA